MSVRKVIKTVGIYSDMLLVGQRRLLVNKIQQAFQAFESQLDLPTGSIQADDG